jgi:hypothetical protein
VGSVYGDFLAHYSELREAFYYFEQTAKVGAGYTKVDPTTVVYCIRQPGPGRRLSGTTRSDFNAISPVLKVNDNVHIWYEEQLTLGWFMLYKNEVYRIVREKDWMLEGGFYAYELEKLVGNNGTPETELAVKAGEV